MTRVPTTLLMRVEAVWELRGRLVLDPGVEDRFTRNLVGCPVRVIRPDGTSCDATVDGVAMQTPNFTRRYPMALASLPAEYDVPPGSEVWLLGAC